VAVGRRIGAQARVRALRRGRRLGVREGHVAGRRAARARLVAEAPGVPGQRVVRQHEVAQAVEGLLPRDHGARVDGAEAIGRVGDEVVEVGEEVRVGDVVALQHRRVVAVGVPVAGGGARGEVDVDLGRPGGDAGGQRDDDPPRHLVGATRLVAIRRLRAVDGRHQAGLQVERRLVVVLGHRHPLALLGRVRAGVLVAVLALDRQRGAAGGDALHVGQRGLDANAAVVDAWDAGRGRAALDAEVVDRALGGRRRRGALDVGLRPRVGRRVALHGPLGALQARVGDVALGAGGLHPGRHRREHRGEVRVDERLVAVDVHLLGVRVEDDVLVEVAEGHLVVDPVGVEPELGIEPVAQRVGRRVVDRVVDRPPRLPVDLGADVAELAGHARVGVRVGLGHLVVGLDDRRPLHRVVGRAVDGLRRLADARVLAERVAAVGQQRVAQRVGRKE
jgi:hypothetical protein